MVLTIAPGKTIKPIIVRLVLATVLFFSGIAHCAESEVEHLAQILELKPGASVANVGAGSGEISIAIAKYVEPGGRVYSTEIDPKLFEKIRRGVLKARTGEVLPVLGTAQDTGLPPGCCDAIFLREVYHHLTDPIAIDRSLFRSMRSGARLAIIDFEPSQRPGEPAPAGVPSNRGGHGVPKQIVEEELHRTGFEMVKTIEWPISPTVRHYCMLFRKP